MKEITLSALWTILEELMSPQVLWVMVGVAGLLLLLFAVAVGRRHGFSGKPASIGIRTGLVVSLVAMIAAPFLTQASFHNILGSVDWIALVIVGFLAFVATVVAVYGVMGVGRRT